MHARSACQAWLQVFRWRGNGSADLGGIQVFVRGEHIGGLFTGAPRGDAPGLAALQESGALAALAAAEPAPAA